MSAQAPNANVRGGWRAGAPGAHRRRHKVYMYVRLTKQSLRIRPKVLGVPLREGEKDVVPQVCI